MNPATLQLINTVIGALIIASIIAIAKWVTGKADKTELAKLEVKLDAALLIAGASITRPELAEKLLAISGRADDKTQRIIADIVQLTTNSKEQAKATADTDRKLDDLPGRVRALEETEKRK